MSRTLMQLVKKLCEEEGVDFEHFKKEMLKKESNFYGKVRYGKEEKKTIKKLSCLRCGHSWFPKKPHFEPISCPKCTSPYWKTKPKKKRSEKMKLEKLVCEECDSDVIRTEEGTYECSKPSCAKIYKPVEE